jgi:hypothetical protein
VEEIAWILIQDKCQLSNFSDKQTKNISPVKSHQEKIYIKHLGKKQFKRNTVLLFQYFT